MGDLEVEITHYRSWIIGRCVGEGWDQIGVRGKFYVYQPNAIRAQYLGDYLKSDGKTSDECDYFDSIGAARAAIDQFYNYPGARAMEEMKKKPHTARTNP